MNRHTLLIGLLALAVALNGPRSGAGLGAGRRPGPALSACAVDPAERRETIDLASFPESFVPANGEYLIVWINVVNTGASVAEYDYCPPEIACVNPQWFEVVDSSGAAFPVDETVRAAFDSSDEQVLRFGNEILPGSAARIVLVFDVPAGGTSWTIRATARRQFPFSLPIPSRNRRRPSGGGTQAEMQQVVPVGDIDIVVTRAEYRATSTSYPSPRRSFPRAGSTSSSIDSDERRQWRGRVRHLPTRWPALPQPTLVPAQRRGVQRLSGRACRRGRLWHEPGVSALRERAARRIPRNRLSSSSTCPRESTNGGSTPLPMPRGSFRSGCSSPPLPARSRWCARRRTVKQAAREPRWS